MKHNQYDNAADFLEAIVRQSQTGVSDPRLGPEVHDLGVSEDEWNEIKDTATRVLGILEKENST